MNPAARNAPATIHRVINLAHVRAAEYDRTQHVLRVEYSNGDMRTLLNIGDCVLDAFPPVIVVPELPEKTENI